MACSGRGGDWIVPRRLMCFLFWSGIVLLFAGILMVVTIKHKGQIFLSWGGVLLGVGSCVLLTCLILCIHAYYVIAESRSNAEHALINNLQLQRKAYATHSCSLNLDGISDVRDERYPTPGHDLKPNSNGGYTELRYTPTNQSQTKSHAHYRTFPSEKEGEDDLEELEKELMEEEEDRIRMNRSSETLTSDSRANSIYTVSRASRDISFSNRTQEHSLSFLPPPAYSQLSSPSPSWSGVLEPSDRVYTRGVPEEQTQKSLSTKIESTMPHRKGVLVSGKNSGYVAHPNTQIVELVNGSSLSSAPNSSMEFEETTDLEVSRTLTSGRFRNPSRETRLLNNTPVNLVDRYTPSEVLLNRRPNRLNLEQSSYDSDDLIDAVTSFQRVASKLSPAEARVAEARTLDHERPVTPGSRRQVGPESITRPFGVGTVTVTPLYRPPPPKTPPSRQNRELILNADPRNLESQRFVAPTARATVRTPDSLRTFRVGSSRPVPTVSVTPCVADGEIDVSICQSDVTVYDNVMDSVRV